MIAGMQQPQAHRTLASPAIRILLPQTLLMGRLGRDALPQPLHRPTPWLSEAEPFWYVTITGCSFRCQTPLLTLSLENKP
jgi:hypothetical protein